MWPSTVLITAFTTVFNIFFTNHDYVFITVIECPVLCSIVTVHYSMTDLCARKSMHFPRLEPCETDKNVLKFTKNLVLKFQLLLGPLQLADPFVYLLWSICLCVTVWLQRMPTRVCCRLWKRWVQRVPTAVLTWWVQWYRAISRQVVNWWRPSHPGPARHRSCLLHPANHCCCSTLPPR